MDIPDTQGLQAVGWRGFLDTAYLLESFGALVLSTILGALIAFHPTAVKKVDTVEEAELPKVQILCALVGAMVGVIVLEYGLVVGFVVFGLGGLMRFRTEADNTRDTSSLIIVTLIGLICGLNLPHFAVLATLYAWVVILFDGNPIYSLEVHEVPKGRMAEASAAYRAGLGDLGCKLISENKSFSKRRLTYIIRAKSGRPLAALETALNEKIAPDIRGELDWQVR
ncbi:MAG: hypothetical protein HXY21_09730 [Parvularculaceae bacterium]|nr:hypothetical protein [Parvularculaceae bacterium]